jgi:hypothetical protein
MLDEKYFRHKLIYVMNPFLTKNKVIRLYAYYPRRYETFPFLHKKYILLLKTKITCKVISFLLFEILIPENENTEDGELEEGIEKEKISNHIIPFFT